MKRRTSWKVAAMDALVFGDHNTMLGFVAIYRSTEHEWAWSAHSYTGAERQRGTAKSRKAAKLAAVTAVRKPATPPAQLELAKIGGAS